MVPGQRAGSGKAAAGFRIPRPSAAGLGEGAWSEVAGRRTPCARESCNSDSSPEPAANLFGEGLVRRGLVGALRARREL